MNITINNDNKVRAIMNKLGISPYAMLEYHERGEFYIIYYCGSCITISDYELEKQSVTEIVKNVKRLVERG